METQSHPTWICCSQQEKPEKGKRRLQPQETRSGASSTPPQHGVKDPAELAEELFPAGVVTPG